MHTIHIRYQRFESGWYVGTDYRADMSGSCCAVIRLGGESCLMMLRQHPGPSRGGPGTRLSGHGHGLHFRYFRSLLRLDCWSGGPTRGYTDPEEPQLDGKMGGFSSLPNEAEIANQHDISAVDFPSRRAVIHALAMCELPKLADAPNAGAGCSRHTFTASAAACIE